MELTELPIDLLHTIAKYCTLADSKMMSQTSKHLNSIFTPRIWHHPLFKDYSLSMKNLEEFSHLPIKELHTRSISFPWWEEWHSVINFCPLLRTLHLDDDENKGEIRHFQGLIKDSKVSVVLHTNLLLTRDSLVCLFAG